MQIRIGLLHQKIVNDRSALWIIRHVICHYATDNWLGDTFARVMFDRNAWIYVKKKTIKTSDIFCVSVRLCKALRLLMFTLPQKYSIGWPKLLVAGQRKSPYALRRTPRVCMHIKCRLIPGVGFALLKPFNNFPCNSKFVFQNELSSFSAPQSPRYYSVFTHDAIREIWWNLELILKKFL